MKIVTRFVLCSSCVAPPFGVFVTADSLRMASRLLLTGRRGHENNQRAAPHRKLMKAMLLIKILFVAAIFMLLVLMGLHNRAQVDFNLPPVLTSQVQEPAALMYFAFFAVGLITGTVLSMGGHRETNKSKKPA